MFGEEVLVPEPGVPRVEVAFDAEVGPVFELVDEVVLRGARLLAEGVAGEVDGRLVAEDGKIKFLAQGTQRIRRIASPREIQ